MNLPWQLGVSKATQAPRSGCSPASGGAGVGGGGACSELVAALLGRSLGHELVPQRPLVSRWLPPGRPGLCGYNGIQDHPPTFPSSRKPGESEPPHTNSEGITDLP